VKNVGQYVIQQGTLRIDDGNSGANYTITYQEALLTIETRPITVTADDQEKFFGELDPALTYKITSGGLVGTDTFSGALSRVGGEAVGSYEILDGSLTITDGNQGKNYDLSFIGGTLTIKPIMITSVEVSRYPGASRRSVTGPPGDHCGRSSGWDRRTHSRCHLGSG
jgi:large repetitive protein